MVVFPESGAPPIQSTCSSARRRFAMEVNPRSDLPGVAIGWKKKTTPTGRSGAGACSSNLISNAVFRRTPTEACGPGTGERFRLPAGRARCLSPGPVAERASVWGSREPVLDSDPHPRLGFSCPASVRRSVNSSGSYVHTSRTVPACQPLFTSNPKISLTIR